MNHHSPELTAAATTKPAAEISTAAPCEQCAKPFTPRHGGKPQRFCSEPCRMAFHAEAREAGKAIVEGNRATCTLPIPPAATMTPVQPPVAIGDDAFDWADDESVVLREQPMTAAYFNKNGELVIRQARWPDDDVFIYIAQNNLADFIDKLTDSIGVPSVGRA